MVVFSVNLLKNSTMFRRDMWLCCNQVWKGVQGQSRLEPKTIQKSSKSPITTQVRSHLCNFLFTSNNYQYQAFTAFLLNIFSMELNDMKSSVSAMIVQDTSSEHV